MGKDEYSHEIRKRISERIEARYGTRRVAIISTVAPLIVNGIAYIIFFRLWGLDAANQQILSFFIGTVGLEILLLGVFLFSLRYYDVPEEIYNQQKKIIAERLPDQLFLKIERTPYIVTRDGKDFQVAALFITSQEKKKIVELRALLNLEHFYYQINGEHVRQTGYHLNAPLYWNDDNLPVKEIELRPDTPKVLIICELREGKTSDGEKIFIALMGSGDPVTSSTAFGEESVFQIKITFQGKLEGEDNFRTLHYADLLYTKPKDKRILFLDDAEKAYSDIPKKLLDRSKIVVKYLDAK